MYHILTSSCIKHELENNSEHLIRLSPDEWNLLPRVHFNKWLHKMLWYYRHGHSELCHLNDAPPTCCSCEQKRMDVIAVNFSHKLRACFANAIATGGLFVVCLGGLLYAHTRISGTVFVWISVKLSKSGYDPKPSSGHQNAVFGFRCVFLKPTSMLLWTWRDANGLAGQIQNLRMESVEHDVKV